MIAAIPARREQFMNDQRRECAGLIGDDAKHAGRRMNGPLFDTGAYNLPYGRSVHQFITASFAGQSRCKSCNGGHMICGARRCPPRNGYCCSNYFLAAAFLTAAFLAGAFLTAALGATFFAGAFFATDFFAGAFFTAAFVLTALFLAVATIMILPSFSVVHWDADIYWLLRVSPARTARGGRTHNL